MWSLRISLIMGTLKTGDIIDPLPTMSSDGGIRVLRKLRFRMNVGDGFIGLTIA